MTRKVPLLMAIIPMKDLLAIQIQSSTTSSTSTSTHSQRAFQQFSRLKMRGTTGMSSRNLFMISRYQTQDEASMDGSLHEDLMIT